MKGGRWRVPGGGIALLALGPGPVAGTTYLYVGDIGGDTAGGTVRDRVQVLRVPEPMVDPAWAESPRSGDFIGVESFLLRYPEGHHDAEALLVDSATGEVWLATKAPTDTRLYRARLTSPGAGDSQVLEFVRSLPFPGVSAGDIAADGSALALRREELAWLWARCDDEPLTAALARPGTRIPVVGPPREPNGECFAFLREGTGYLTLSEGPGQPLHYFASRCPRAPRFPLGLGDQTAFAGATVRVDARAVGWPEPAYVWRFNGQAVLGATNATLVLEQVSVDQTGTYTVVAANALGTATNQMTLTVRPKPDLRITEVQSSTAPNNPAASADWWELTSFESQTVDLSGWRFNDQAGGTVDAFVFPAGWNLGPGESLVLVEALTPAQFRAWWGESNVPAEVRIVSYQGSGLSFAASGDGVRLWSPVPGTSGAPVASVDFGAATHGVTFNYDPVSGQFGGISRLGVHGVLRAASAADLGSPGRILAPAVGPQLRVTGGDGAFRLEFDATVGRAYHVERRPAWSDATWLPTGELFRAVSNGAAVLEPLTAPGAAFHRLRVE